MKGINRTYDNHCPFPFTFAERVLSPSQTHINAMIAAMYHAGLRYAVICPGSRNAPLVMALSRYPGMHCISSVDERSAAFMALGMAKQLRETVAVCCTSGSAVLNFYPAVAEAYYMQVPLLLLTADRPPELIDRWDGQAIHQFGVFGSHVKASFNADGEQTEDFIRLGARAIRLAADAVKGPVHINVPLREPLYADALSTFEYPQPVLPAWVSEQAEYSRPADLFAAIRDSRRILILNGASDPDPEAAALLIRLSQEKGIPVLSDLISGRMQAASPKNWESVLLALNDQEKEALVPDLLISCGKMVLNKTLKNLFKQHAPAQHWHIAANGYCADPFFTQARVLAETDAGFFRALLEDAELNTDPLYKARWDAWSTHPAIDSQIQTADSGFTEFSALRRVLRSLEQDLVLHVSNSMPVRLLAYSADLIGRQWEVSCNRGVSGIDGCTSTALGMALINPKQHMLISGDLAFFYDINAFLSNPLPANIKIILLNNRGGGIFLQIDGPSTMPEADPFLITPHHLSARHLAAHYGLPYFAASDAQSLEEALSGFHACEGICILEIFSDRQHNSNIFKQYKSFKI